MPHVHVHIVVCLGSEGGGGRNGEAMPRAVRYGKAPVGRQVNERNVDGVP